MSQPDLFTVHEAENNRESLTNLNENRHKFNKQCLKVFNLLMGGNRLTVRDAIVEHGINSLPRRLLDLKQAGVLISDEWNRDHKIWFMTPDQQKANRGIVEKNAQNL